MCTYRRQYFMATARTAAPVHPQSANEGMRGSLAEHGRPLTVRQKKVIRLVSLGCSVRDVGQILGISPSTADNHKSKAMARLGIAKIAVLTRYAISSRISSLDDRLTAEELELLGYDESAPSADAR